MATTGGVANFVARINFEDISQARVSKRILEGHRSRLQTGIAKIVVSGKSIKRVSFLPVLFSRSEDPAQVLTSRDRKFSQIVNYITAITQEAGVRLDFRVEGDELVMNV